MEKSPEWCAFMESYRTFVTQEVAPLCGDPTGVVFQSPPTIRVVMPSMAPTIHPHCDSQYPRHQNCEINFWVPVTTVWGNNTLHLESSPGKEDFHPATMEPGTFLRFNGYHCKHLTHPNDTGHTRVSFDFRAVPQSLYKAYISEGPGRKRDKAKIGDYLTERTGPVTLRR
mmetsp:Transcript_17629/g.28169  ORF Transcript_17629/g.28169 Transcript_17629/m.28169 type:complete len:170 (-) Transcript_17629:338-847(-)